MKKIFLSVITIVTISVAAQAQLKVGVKTGGNLSTQHRNDASTSKLVSKDAFKGFHAGFIADANILGNLYLQPQLMYSQKGVKYNSNATGTKSKLTLNSIEVPVNIVYKAELPFGKLFAGAGPVINYGFGGKLEQNGQSSKIFKGDVKNWKRFDISANALAGIEFNSGLFASVNYQRGFKDVYKPEAIDVKNRSVSVSVGYLVSLGKPIEKK